MSFEDKINQIESLQQAIQKHGKLADDVLKRINYKFRLEWNYHSNKMEGGSLTRQETRTVMIGNITVEGKPIKDVMDMKGHDDVITSIIKMGKGELNFSEKRIKEIHEAIIYEEDPEKKKQIGKWKTQPNYLYNYKNERFDFVDPLDVPEAMHKLINWVNAQKEKIERKDKDALHPLQLAFQFHLDYITIHPFYDGNGRTARIFTNLILIAYGYPPIYIKTEEKGIYYQYLADIQGYGGAPDLFFEFMAELLLRSQQIVLNAIEGKNIEEPDDWDKKLFLLKTELNPNNGEELVIKELDRDVFREIYKSWLSKLLQKTVYMVQKFNDLFVGVNHIVSIDNFKVKFYQNPSDVVGDVSKTLNEYFLQSAPKIDFVIVADYGNFKNAGLKTFECKYSMELRFQSIKYELWVPDFDPYEKKEIKLFEKLLHQPLSEDEMDIAVKAFGNTIFNHIDYYTKQQGLR